MKSEPKHDSTPVPLLVLNIESHTVRTTQKITIQIVQDNSWPTAVRDQEFQFYIKKIRSIDNMNKTEGVNYNKSHC